MFWLCFRESGLVRSNMVRNTTSSLNVIALPIGPYIFSEHVITLVYQWILNGPLLHPSVPMPFPGSTIKFRIRGSFRARKKKKTSAERVIMKCRKVLWLEARVALWSSCKPTQSGESRFSLCKKIYEWTAAALIAQQLYSNSLMEDERMEKGKGRRTVRWKKLVIGY